MPIMRSSAGKIDASHDRGESRARPRNRSSSPKIVAPVLYGIGWGKNIIRLPKTCVRVAAKPSPKGSSFSFWGRLGGSSSH
jgi:hypothetical protein